jgi:RNA methyltransferase, TrmH family
VSEQLTFSNPKVQRLRRLLGRRSSRYDDRCFVIEGAPLIRQAIDAGWEIEGVYIDGVPPADLTRFAWFSLGPNVIDRVASTETPMRELAVARMPDTVGLPVGADFVVVCDRLNDPGNAGTIIRSAEAAGAAAVVLTPGSVDPYNPKVVRASAGSLFRMPVVGLTVDQVRAHGLRLLATSSHAGDIYTEADLRGPVALLVGNEAHGLGTANEPGGATAVVDGWLTIPHAGPAESLNVAVAASVLMFEVARQRRAGLS